MKNPHDMVQMDILGPFYLSNSGAKNYFIISCLDDCSRKVVQADDGLKKRSIDVLNVLEDWIMNNGKPKTVIHDKGKRFISKSFKHFLVHNNIGDKRIPNFYPQMQGKIEAYNKIVKNEFLALEDIPNIEDGKLRYDMLSRCTTILKNMEGLMVLLHQRCFYKA